MILRGLLSGHLGLYCPAEYVLAWSVLCYQDQYNVFHLVEGSARLMLTHHFFLYLNSGLSKSPEPPIFLILNIASTLIIPGSKHRRHYHVMRWPDQHKNRNSTHKMVFAIGRNGPFKKLYFIGIICQYKIHHIATSRDGRVALQIKGRYGWRRNCLKE